MDAETQASTGTIVEAELKLAIPDEASGEALIAAVRERATLGELTRIPLEDTYFDTPGGALRRAGLGARSRRKGDADWVMIKPVLVLPQPLLVRPEIGRELADGERPTAALQAIVEQELGVILDAPLEPVLILKNTRGKGVIEHEAFRAELCDDHVTAELPDGSQRAAHREVEFELLDGDVEALTTFVQALRRDLDVPGTTLGKYVRARELLGLPGFTYGPPRVELDAGAPAQELVRRQLGRQLERVGAFAPGTAVSLDPEHLHSMRVSTRRLRSGLRVFRKSLDTEGRKRLGNGMKALGRILGELRDLDVHLENANRDREQMGDEATDALVASLNERRGPVVLYVREQIQSDAFPALLSMAREVIEAEAPEGAPAGTAGELVARMLRKEGKRFAKHVKALEGVPTADDLHDVRIAGKRLRYAIEFAAPVLDGEGVPLVDRLKRVQDELGAFQDDIALLERADLGGGATSSALQKVAERVGDPAAYLARVLDELDVKQLRKALKRISHRLVPPPAAEPTAGLAPEVVSTDDAPPTSA